MTKRGRSRSKLRSRSRQRLRSRSRLKLRSRLGERGGKREEREKGGLAGKYLFRLQIRFPTIFPYEISIILHDFN